MLSLESKILIVDDMMTMRRMMAKVLRELGYANIVEAADGQLAYEAIVSHMPALVLSDINMPNCNGIDFLKRVRADARVKHIPIVMVTAESESSMVKEAIQNGADQYVVKPFDKDIIKTKIDIVMKKLSKVA